ncbi:carboxylesterase family protein [Carboxylicivirga marina]|uniref:Dienelactone hydrolase family protein n=1 Tax=Carboxylicivirga marina TaxID=2800988 RepID=A0ABS1HG98_9BACT|nr:dienelactone hydrolase family protein [Carboxylicivirga marina]MBK3516214.1 dienelactone hydrolase family protein [Carboxylicivirga marina]
MKYLPIYFTCIGLTFIFTLNACDKNADQANTEAEVPVVPPNNENKDKIADYADIENLPKDIGGEQIAHLKGSTAASYGYYAYTPSAYHQGTEQYPLIISLHGAGKRGDGTNLDDLKKVLWLGPGNLIKKGEWSPSYPAIVIAPITSTNWEPNKVQTFIQYLIDTYRVNEQRIYLTGNSMGGFGTWSYIQEYGEDALVAAIVPICGKGNPDLAHQFTNIPVWAFHGVDDKTVDVYGSINMVKAIKALEADITYTPKLTLYPNVGHDCWTMTYDGSGMGQGNPNFDAFDMSIYDWLFRYKKSK